MIYEVLEMTYILLLCVNLRFGHSLYSTRRFASLFPVRIPQGILFLRSPESIQDKVGRVIVDGAVDAMPGIRVGDDVPVLNPPLILMTRSSKKPFRDTAEAVEKGLFSIFESLRTNIVTLYDGVETMVYIDRKFALVALSMALYSAIRSTVRSGERRWARTLQTGYKFH